MIMQLAGDSDAGPLLLEKDEPEDYKDNHSGKHEDPRVAHLCVCVCVWMDG